MPLICNSIENAAEHHAAINFKVGVLEGIGSIKSKTEQTDAYTQEQSMIMTFDIPSQQKEIN
jgi:hypothetical protein